MDHASRIIPSMIKVASTLEARISFLLFYQHLKAFPRGTIRFRLHCLRRGCTVYLHASSLKKPPPLFSYRCVKLSERHPYRWEEASVFPVLAVHTTVHQICSGTLFSGRRTAEVSARALYQVWV